MNLPIELIKYTLFAIIIIVMCFKVFELTKRMVRKWRDKDDDINLKDLEKFDTL